MKQIIAIALLLLFPISIYSQNLKDIYLNGIKEHLANGNCEGAEKVYNLAVEGKHIKPDKEIEAKIADCKGTVLRIDSKPSGATVYLDDEKIGITPLTTKPIEKGDHKLQFSLSPMYSTKTITYTIPEGGDMQIITQELQPNYSYVTIVAPNQADIYVNGEKKGCGEWKDTLRLGTYFLEARKSLHHSIKDTLIIKDVIPQTINMKAPIPQLGDLEVNTIPSGATVYVDRKEYGTTPITINDLFIGEKRLTLKKEGYDDIESSINIKENIMLSKEYTMSRIINYPNGDKYIGEFYNGKKEGQGTYYYSNGDKYEGEWYNDKKEGEGTYYYSNGDKYEGEWNNDKMSGDGKIYDKYGYKKDTWNGELERSVHSRRYKLFIEAGMHFGYGPIVSSGCALSISVSNGYQFNQHIYLGAGFGGIVSFDQESMIPIFANSKIYMSKGVCTPLLDLKLGYAFKDAKGLYLSPSFGFRAAINRHFGFFSYLGYTCIKYNKEQINTFLHGYTFSIGIDFP